MKTAFVLTETKEDEGVQDNPIAVVVANSFDEAAKILGCEIDFIRKLYSEVEVNFSFENLTNDANWEKRTGHNDNIVHFLKKPVNPKKFIDPTTFAIVFKAKTPLCKYALRELGCFS